MAQHSAVRLANEFILKYSASGIDHLKLQKLAYFAYGWWLAYYEGTRLTTVRPQIWKLGPVFQPIYGAFAGFKSDYIKTMQLDNPFSPPQALPDAAAEAKQLVDWIWSRYGKYSGVELSNMTHEFGTPWFEAAKRHNFVIPRYTEMDDDEIRAYFVGVAKKEGLIQ